MMDLNQTKFYVLVLKLELKAREFNELCKLLDEVKEKNINPNDESLLDLKEKFLNNQKEINEIKSLIEKLNNEYDKKYNIDDMFKSVKNMKTEEIKEKLELIDTQTEKENIFIRIINKLKNILT